MCVCQPAHSESLISADSRSARLTSIAYLLSFVHPSIGRVMKMNMHPYVCYVKSYRM